MNIEGFVSTYEYIIERMIRIFKVKNKDFVEDIKQELRMKLVSVYDQVIGKDSIENLESYLFIILKRTTINILKKESRFKHLSLNQKKMKSDEEWINEIPDTHSNDDSTQKVEEILIFITDSFTKDEINIFHLYFEKKMSLEKISEMHQTSRETIRRKINIMKEKIRRWYT
jgi:RNA polymerase sigma factor (sigma-70 family)